MRIINSIILHCSDSDDSLDIGYKEINQWHKQRGWLSPSGISCGYHYIIRRNGTVEVGRPEAEMGAHCRGHNRLSIGICLVGRSKFSDKQLESMRKLIIDRLLEHELSLFNLYGHYEKDKGKTCPNIDMTKLRAELVFDPNWILKV